MINIIAILIFAVSFNTVNESEIKKNERAFLQTGTISVNIINPEDQDRKMSLLTNAQLEVCFQCALPGSECYTYPYTCFEGSSY